MIYIMTFRIFFKHEDGRDMSFRKAESLSAEHRVVYMI
jgi:hypothetical protein